VLKPASSWRGRTLADSGTLEDNTRVFAIIRGEHMLVPRPETTLEAGDRLILVTTADGLERLKAHLEKW
jgi:Trk K+ transport system NAD-binding subunit